MHTKGSREKAWGKYLAASQAPDVRDRIMRHVRADGDCWLWMSGDKGNGYGVITVYNNPLLAHRLSKLVFHGPFDPAMDIDHLCRTPRCVNPDHLEAVSHRENMVRGNRALSSHCIHGHEFTEENTKVRADGARECRHCTRHRNSTRVRDRRRVKVEAGV